MRALVSSKATAKANQQCAGIDLLHQRDHLRGVALILQPVVAILVLDVFDELILECLADLPDLAVGDIADGIPNGLVRLVVEEVPVERPLAILLPFRGHPRGQMHAVGDVAHMQLLGEIALPHGGEHLARDDAVEVADAVGLLTGVEGEGAHAELLRATWIGAAHVDKVLPADAELVGELAHVFAEERLLEVVVAGGHGRVHRI